MPEGRLRHEWTSSVIVLRTDRKVLLIYHAKLGVWLGPGGHIEPGESPDEAALREVLEETGLAVDLLGQRDHALDDPRHGVECLALPYVILKERIHDARDSHIHLDLIYCARLSIGAAAAEASITSDHRARFASEDELAELPMFANYRALLARVFADQRLWSAVRAESALGAARETHHVDADLQP